MPFQSAPDTAEAVINYVQNGQPIVNRINFEHTGGYDQAAIDLLAVVIDGMVDTVLIPLLTDTITYLFTKVRGLENPIDLEATNATNTGAGTAAGDDSPQQTSYVVKLGTGATGRSARGRFYMPGLSQAALSSARTVTTTYSNAAVDALADIIAEAAIAGWDAVVTSRQQGGIILPVAENRVITDVIASNLNVDTQRRRVGK